AGGGDLARAPPALRRFVPLARGARDSQRQPFWPSLTRWIFVPKPPRERPRPWSAGSPGGRFFFRGSRRRASSADVGAVDAEQLGVDQPGRVEPQLEPLDDPVEQAAAAHLAEPVVDGLPRSEAFGQVAPGGSGVEPPEDPVEHQAVILPLSAPLAGTGREEGSHKLPLLVGKFVPLHTTLDAEAPCKVSSDRA